MVLRLVLIQKDHLQTLTCIHDIHSHTDIQMFNQAIESNHFVPEIFPIFL